LKILFYSIRFIWELPQNLLGMIVFILQRKKIISIKRIAGRFYFKNKYIGISLGSFIFWMPLLSDNNFNFPTVMKHEFGHSVQSVYFGPLYLILVGIPSISRVIYSKIFFSFKKRHWQNYYNGYPEKWADTLGEKHYKKLPYQKV